MGARAGDGWKLGQGIGGSYGRGCMDGSEGRDEWELGQGIDGC